MTTATSAEEEYGVSYACADPPPKIVTYTNSVTNETKTESIPTKISSLQVVFDYNVFHPEDVTFGEASSKGVLDSIKDSVSNIFNKEDGEEKKKQGEENLIALEKCMVDNIWKTMLANDMMTWVEGTSGEGNEKSQCAGLLIDEKSRRVLQDDGNTLVETEEAEPIVNDADANAGETPQPLVIDDAGMDQTQPVIIDETSPINNSSSTQTDAATTFTGTKLIGMESFPLDYVNTNGCPGASDTTCTSIRGVIAASYIGINENGVAESIARMLQDGMNSGSFLCEGSPATKIEFDTFIGQSKGGHGALILNTSRGMAEPPNSLTKYGIIFVVFVVLLAAGVIAGVVYKKKKMKNSKEMGSTAEQDFEANLALEEGVVAVGGTTTDDENARTETPTSEEPQQPDALMVELSESFVGIDGDDAAEVEISLSPKRGKTID